MKRLAAALRRSLFARLLLIFVATAFAFGALDNLVELFSERERPYRALLRTHLTHYVGYLKSDVGSPPNPANAREMTRTLPIEIRIEGPEVNWTSHPRFEELDDLEFDEHGFAHRWRRHGRYFLRTSVDEHAVIFATPPFDYEPHFGVARHFMLLGSLVIVAFCYLAVRRLFAPIRLLRDGVQRIGEGELSYRVPVKRSDELGELARAVNDMAGDVEQMLESKRQLLFAISHELRSPITRARLALELMEATDKRALGDDLDEMERIVADLLEGERLGSRHRVLNRESCRLDELVREVVAAEFADASVAIDEQSPIPLSRLDAPRVRLLVRNILTNAITHGEGKPVTVSLRADQDSLEFEVSDQGKGIAAEYIEKVTEAFYRVDASRHRGTGGMGLGLYLCRRIAEAHGGSLSIDSKPERGTTVRVTLPIGEASVTGGDAPE